MQLEAHVIYRLMADGAREAHAYMEETDRATKMTQKYNTPN